MRCGSNAAGATSRRLLATVGISARDSLGRGRLLRWAAENGHGACMPVSPFHERNRGVGDGSPHVL